MTIKSVYFFTAPTCGSCKRAKEAVATFCANHKIPWTIVDVSDDNITPARYCVQSVPTVIGLKNNQPFSQISGNITAERMEGLFDDIYSQA